MAENQPIISPPEEWRPVVGYEGFYEVSSYGTVRSILRKVTLKNGQVRTYQSKIVKGRPTPTGHLLVNLSMCGVRKNEPIHRVVIKAFIGPPQDGEECCHIDGNPANNHVDNLRWGTRSSNLSDSVRHGTHHSASKKGCPLGHPFDDFNVRPLLRKQGVRGCWACANARSYIANREELLPRFQEIADTYFTASSKGEIVPWGRRRKNGRRVDAKKLS